LEVKTNTHDSKVAIYSYMQFNKKSKCCWT